MRMRGRRLLSDLLNYGKELLLGDDEREYTEKVLLLLFLNELRFTYFSMPQ